MNSENNEAELPAAAASRAELLAHVNLQLASLGQPGFQSEEVEQQMGFAGDLLRDYQQQKRLLADYRCPVDQRIEQFLNDYLHEHGVTEPLRLPGSTLVLDRPGLACELSIPADGNRFSSQYVDSYRLLQGVLHNPVSDRRTTKGVFHIVEGGLPVPFGKKAVPVQAYRALFERAVNPPAELLTLPFTSAQTDQARVWVSLLMRPTVSPALAGHSSPKSLEIRYLAPGSLVSNLDFVERIFGNAGNPFLPENDAALDIDGWTGHTGCIILAPHLVGCRARDLGLPHYDQATARQREDGMYWKSEQDLYNGGEPFKIVCRDMRGVVVTILADNYYGYSKKEVKSQISYSANLFGGCEEEHAGGALAFSCANLGDVFEPEPGMLASSRTFAQVVADYPDRLSVQEAGYGIDRHYPDIVYVPQDARIDLLTQSVSWHQGGTEQSIKLLAGQTYMYPSGYRVRIEKHPSSPTWRLIGTEPEGVYCHKPCTVSGGGKSEISKSIVGSLLSGPLYVGDLKEDLDLVAEIFQRDYSTRFNANAHRIDHRPFLSADRSLGSSIKLLTPSPAEFTDEYNAWLETIPLHIRALAFIIKRFYRPEWGDDWREHFTVDIINGYPGHELKFDDRAMVANYMRVGENQNGSWRLYKLRQDYVGADKVQMEDDISTSITVPADALEYTNPEYVNRCLKLTVNCESKLFQRPDDAVYRGRDVQAEADLSAENTFISNFEPLGRDFAVELVQDAIGFGDYTPPMQQLIQRAATMEAGEYFVSSAHPRLVNGTPTLNVRYLQDRPDRVNARDKHIAEMGVRLHRAIPDSKAVHWPVNAVLSGRRNNAGDPARGIRPLAVYNPLHYHELPELFMDYIASLTGKSPSTTGAGSEGALTKGPFNSVAPTADLNNALVSSILCGYDGFSTPAGHIGPNYQIDHDISLLIPEIWCRIPVAKRSARFMIDHGYLERLEDFEYQGKKVLASRLGYRITSQFVHEYMGKIFDNPNIVFEEGMLQPETQDTSAYIDGIDNIVEAQRRVALGYLEDGSVDTACPPLQALLYIMATGEYQGKDISDPSIRQMFTADYLLQSDWYQQRLRIKQTRDAALWRRHAAYIASLIQEGHLDEAELSQLAEKQATIHRQLKFIESDGYLASLRGTLGADWIVREPAQAPCAQPEAGRARTVVGA